MSDALTEALRGDQAAVRLIRDLSSIFSAQGALDTPATLHKAAWQALVEVPSNPFFQQHADSLRPMVRQALLDSQAAQVMSGGDGHEQTLAFVLRDGLIGLICHCAYLVGGYAWAVEAGPKIRARFHQETLEDFLTRLNPPEASDDGA